jgi:ribosomal peptide maturation radical SAM protein 1
MSLPDVAAQLRPADILFIVPPFAWADRPALGVHLLQGLARRAGLEAQVLYGNLLFAAAFDEGTHTTLASTQFGLLLGERVFARAAYGGPPLGRDGGQGLLPTLEQLRAAFARNQVPFTLELEAILAVEAKVPGWLDSFVPTIAARNYRVVGCTTSFEQNSASIAILNRIKAASPSTVTIIGGANCEAQMAAGIRALSDDVDFIFSGESEATFAAFLEQLAHGRPSGERIFYGKPCQDLDALPTPDYADFHAQLRAWTPHSRVVQRGLISVTYETSRGCWWGEKSHCTFCGLNGEGMGSREKSPDRVIEELKALLAAHPHPSRRVAMTDNIMPYSYFRTLLPRLAVEVPGANIMYEQKANLTLHQVRELLRAGVTEIQPGIEALATPLLKLMAKGTTAAQNLALLRYARATGLRLHWNLLFGFPGDEVSSYLETLELLPLLHHLQPPVSPCPVVIDRFSPYFNRPEQYGIVDLRPFAFYRGVMPEHVPLERIAYHFEGTFESGALANREVVRRIGEEIAGWRRRHLSATPAELRVARRGAGYTLVDTRHVAGADGGETQAISEAQAVAALVTRPLRVATSAADEWARAQRVAVERDGKLVALAIAEPDLLGELEERFRRRSEALPIAV